MSATKNQIFRIRVIDELLARKNWVKSTTMQKVIVERFGEEVSLRTIQNDIRDLKEDSRLGYYAPIEYDKKKKAYKYTEEGYTIKNFGLREQEISAFVFYANCLDIFKDYSLFNDFSNGLNKIIEGVKAGGKISDRENVNKVLQTDSLIVAKGHRFLGEAVSAIDKQQKVLVEYQGFGWDKPFKRTLSPYFLKEYKNRWYLLATSQKEDKIKTYAFDRIKSMKVLDESFNKIVHFDADEYFKHSFGITAPDGEVMKVILRFDIKEMPYVLSLPIHTTQKVVKEGKSYTDISIDVFDSYELRAYILSKTPAVKVVSPQSLRDAIYESLVKGEKKYNKKSTSRK